HLHGPTDERRAAEGKGSRRPVRRPWTGRQRTARAALRRLIRVGREPSRNIERGRAMLRPVRRIVTTNDTEGKSGVMIDGIAGKPITVLTELWITEAGRPNHRDGIDHATRSTQLEPPKGGTLFRYFEIPPEGEFAHLSDAEKQKTAADWFAAMKGGHLR